MKRVSRGQIESEINDFSRKANELKIIKTNFKEDILFCLIPYLSSASKRSFVKKRSGEEEEVHFLGQNKTHQAGLSGVAFLGTYITTQKKC